MKKIIYTTSYLLLLTVAITSCNTNNTTKMKDMTENTVEDSTTNIQNDSIPADTTTATKTDTTEKATIVPLRLMVDKLVTNEGEVEIGVYTPKNKFPDEKDKFKVYRFKPENLKVDVEIKDLPYGEYAFAIYHDENNNGKIDKNLVGIPKEPYAFSNNYKPTIKAPSFKDCNFTYSKESNEVKISLLNTSKK